MSLQRVKITEFNRDTFTIKAEGYEVACVFILSFYSQMYVCIILSCGETFDLKKHPQVKGAELGL